MTKHAPTAPQSNATADIAAEYQAFVRAVSHDFRAPVRHLTNFSKFLVDQIQAPSQEALTYIKHIQSAAGHLEAMQRALVDLADLTTDPGTWQPVDCSALVTQALDTLGADYDLTTYTLDIGPLPTLTGDAPLLAQAFRHLLDNALKFHDPAAHDKRLHLHATAEGTSWHFTLTDNGIGIKPGQEHTLFQIFKRLAPDYGDGLGTGLTFTQKIIRLHGGQIWVEAVPEGQGMALHLVLPQV